jgi:hypothetical protein
LVVRFKEQAFKSFWFHENQPADELRLKLLIVTVLIVFLSLGQNLNCKPILIFAADLQH